MKDESGAFVSREATGETYGQGVSVEKSAHGDDLLRFHSLFSPTGAGALADEGEHLVFQILMHFPYFFVGDVHNAIPERNVIMPFHPFRAQIAIEQLSEFGCNPG